MASEQEQSATRQFIRLKWSQWRLRRAVRRRRGHERERKRLERKYPDGEETIPLPMFLYELVRAAVVGLKLKVKP